MHYWVYIVTNRPHGTLSIGVTNDPRRRIWEHRTGVLPGFTRQYGLKRLVLLEEFREVSAAIAREKQLKGWLRQKKIDLIQCTNPLWRDLSEGWYDEGPVASGSPPSSGPQD